MFPYIIPPSHFKGYPYATKKGPISRPYETYLGIPNPTQF
jgi:hypothetical protein